MENPRLKSLAPTHQINNNFLACYPSNIDLDLTSTLDGLERPISLDVSDKRYSRRLQQSYIVKALCGARGYTRLREPNMQPKIPPILEQT